MLLDEVFHESSNVTSGKERKRLFEQMVLIAALLHINKYCKAPFFMVNLCSCRAKAPVITHMDVRQVPVCSQVVAQVMYAEA